MQEAKRRRLGRKAWRALLAQFADSGLTVAAFCRREAVGTASFYRWRSQLEPASAVAARSPVAPVSAGTTADFVDLGPLLTTGSAPQVPHFTLEFRLLGSSESEAGRGFSCGKRQPITKVV